MSISIRRFPYPFQAMLAICSDLDGTPDGHVYFSMMRYLNTFEDTPFGSGIGLEIGNSIYFNVASPQFCYWNTSDVGRAMARRLIRSGHIDCLHSFGSRATTRADAARALEELEKHNCLLQVWVDHAKVPTNFGSDVTAGTGDIPGSLAYHADLTTSYGIQYVWRGRVTSIIGQNIQRNFRGIASIAHPLASCKTLVKEFAKGLSSSTQYTMNRNNELIRNTYLRNGSKVKEFLRFNPYWGGINIGATADILPEVLTTRTLNWLIKKEGCSVLYTHLGRAIDPQHPFSPRTKVSLSLLSEYTTQGKILVTTTRRLLDYCLAVKKVQFSVSPLKEITRIDITKDQTDPPLDGLTMYVQDPARTKVYMNNCEIQNLQKNAPDHTGRPSISLPWQKLTFPPIEEVPHA